MSISSSNEIRGNIANSRIKGTGIYIKGDDGNGIEKIEKTDSDGLIDTYTITFTNGTTSEFTVTNGKNGIDGINGSNGENGTNGKSLQYNWDGTKLGIKLEGDEDYIYVDLKGEQGKQGIQGNPGEVSLEQLNQTKKDILNETDKKISNLKTLPTGRNNRTSII